MKGFKCKIVLHKIFLLCSDSETEQTNPIFNSSHRAFFFPQKPELKQKTPQKLLWKKKKLPSIF